MAYDVYYLRIVIVATDAHDYVHINYLFMLVTSFKMRRPTQNLIKLLQICVFYQIDTCHHITHPIESFQMG